MKKTLFIKDISQETEELNEIFLVAEKKILKTKNNDNYLILLLKDKTGSIDAKKWNIGDEEFSNLSSGDIVRVEGSVERFKDRFQIIIQEIEKLDEREEYLNELLPTTPEEIESLSKRLEKFRDKIKGKFIKELIERVIFKDREFFEKFKNSPAASSFHHAYRGGLLEHTVNVVELSCKLGELYRVKNMDILIAGAMLHDVGKVYEYDSKTFKRTDEGRLLGHIAIGVEMVSKAISKIKGFPENEANLIKHIILSHHGEFEWGSPVLPAFLEAIIVHFADLIDSTIQPVLENIDEEGGWKYLKKLKRKLVHINHFDFEKQEEEKKEVKFKNPTLKSIF